MKVGDVVIYHDPVGTPHNALLTSAWEGTENPTVNLVYVSSDEKEQDPYGRQTKRESSVSHKSNTNVHGRYWRRETETPNPYKAPASA
jgi:hypothetical protein